MTAINSVLIVDDESSLRLSLEIILEQAGFAVRGASCLQEAREHLKRYHFDLIFLDMKLSDGMGGDLLPLIHAIVPVPQVIIFSATPPNTLSFKPEEEGIKIYLEKPCDPEEIIFAARKALSISSDDMGIRAF